MAYHNSGPCIYSRLLHNCRNCRKSIWLSKMDDTNRPRLSCTAFACHRLWLLHTLSPCLGNGFSHGSQHILAKNNVMVDNSSPQHQSRVLHNCDSAEIQETSINHCDPRLTAKLTRNYYASSSYWTEDRCPSETRSFSVTYKRASSKLSPAKCFSISLSR